MSLELKLLAWTLILAIAQIFLTAGVLNQERGLKYNAGPRDDPPPPPSRLAARLQRAQANLFETLPLFAAAVLIAHVAGREGGLTRLGAELFLVGRIVYVPLYAVGAPGVRTAAFAVALAGLGLILWACLGPGGA